MACTDTRESARYGLVARRNHSLSSIGRQWVLISLCVLFLAISLGFATLGAWPVLPFAGIELALVYWAFRQMALHDADYESLVIDGDRLMIEIQAKGQRMRFECNKYWAQVRWSTNPDGQRAALRIRSQGKEVEFGQHLPEHKLREVAARIQQSMSQ